MIECLSRPYIIEPMASMDIINIKPGPFSRTVDGLHIW